MHDDLKATLEKVRGRRRFEAGRYMRAKAALVNGYLRRWGLRACVVGVSGGVDSAVTLGLLRHASRAPGSPLERLVAALLPVFAEPGATHQPEALARGREVARVFEAEVMEADLSAGHAAVMASVERGLGVSSGPWAAGQIVSTIRTPALYHAATLLAQGGWPALVVGTTNRDEGSYLGFFGKASDAMVDLQPLADAHKSEVYALGGWLGVPASVLSAAPSGDTFDGRPDEQMIGAPYDFVELYTALRALGAEGDRLREAWGSGARAQFEAWAGRLEALHRVNAHKYLVGSPAVYLDVQERAVPGGAGPADGPPWLPHPGGSFVGETPAPTGLGRRLASLPSSAPSAEPLGGFGESALLLRGLLPPGACELLAQVAAGAAAPLDRHGRPLGPGAAGQPAFFRGTVYDDELARALWARLRDHLPPVRCLDDDAPTDHEGHPVWRPVGLNPMLRFFRHERGGWLVPHHDAAHDLGDGRHRTLMSVVFYLTDAGDGDGGATLLLLDPERHLPAPERLYPDGEAPAAPGEVLARARPERGAALVLDHRVRHEAERWGGASPRLVLRTDVIFARCGPPLAPEAPPSPWLAGRLGLGAVSRRADERRRQADEAYAGLGPGAQGEPALRRAWKILRDPFYAGVHARLGDEGVDEAGFFDDGAGPGPADPREGVRWFTTPVHKITANLARLDPGSGGWLAVLLSTGSFCPVHEGHVRMMELAREELTRRGAAVLGGYLSPSHDRYVKIKCGAEAPDAAHRLRMCELATDDSDWLMADGWEALHAAVALNFTDVIERLGAYLSRHVRSARPVHVVYVFGGDNARFSLSFVDRGRSVCVPRPGHEPRVAPYAAHPLLRSCERVAFAPAASLDAASSRIRRGDEAALAPGVGRHWRSLRTEPAPGALRRLWLRDEGLWALEPWRGLADEASLRRAQAALRQGVAQALGEAFEAAGQRLGLTWLDLDLQRSLAASLRAEGPLLSLDPCLPGDHDLGVSRCFELASDQARPGLAARPGWPPLDEQLARLPGGEWVLLDDDIASGHTLRRVQAALPARCRVKRVVAACELPGPRPEGAELGDLRDLLVGARDAGLVVALPGGELARAPYLLPYVSPSARLGVPLSGEVAFSRRVWLLNEAFFRSLAPRLRLADAAPAFRALAGFLGFDPATPLDELCAWHAARLAPGPCDSGAQAVPQRVDP